VEFLKRFSIRDKKQIRLIVIDIFMGSDTAAVVAQKLNRNYIGIELNPEYIKIAENRINNIKIAN